MFSILGSRGKHGEFNMTPQFVMPYPEKYLDLFTIQDVAPYVVLFSNC